ncbi:MAG: hypothetical protein JSU85_08570 [Candidatus Zixiibacteriota bacterium]|nr:MAG: hypothetical protein JSU85_08570 [candidate division Zixibacteria bacterium]
MFKYIILILTFVSISLNAYSVCIFGKGKTCPKLRDCYYVQPFTDEIQYFYKITIEGKECPVLHQTGYINHESMEGAVLKFEDDKGLSISFTPKFNKKSEIEEFIKKEWPGSQDIPHKSLYELRRFKRR